MRNMPTPAGVACFLEWCALERGDSRVIVPGRACCRQTVHQSHDQRIDRMLEALRSHEEHRQPHADDQREGPEAQAAKHEMNPRQYAQ